MEKENLVFIARSLDGFIAEKDGGLDWLQSIPNPEGNDMGYGEFMDRIDALVMGRNTYEMVKSFGGDWPYNKIVFVLSNSLKSIPNELEDKVKIVKGDLKDVLQDINNKGYNKLYIDGGVTVQNFLKEDLIDELIISTIPILLGDGLPLFGSVKIKLEFNHVESKVFLNQIVQDRYKRKR